jgi:hypothetical protein
MIIEVKQVEPKLPLVIVTLPPNQNTPDYRALLASHGRMTATYQDLGAWLTDKSPETPIHSSLRPAIEIAPTRTKSAYAD